MFKFDFTTDDGSDDEAGTPAAVASLPSNAKSQDPGTQDSQPVHDGAAGEFREIAIEKLLDSLPPIISYSPIEIPIDGFGRSLLYIPRRDLFDARFQLIVSDPTEELELDDDQDKTSTSDDPHLKHHGNTDTEEGGAGAAAVKFLNAPSDLVPGVYEGGFKTWECSVDLILCLLQKGLDGAWLRGKKIIEFGCGTALPSLFVLQELLSSPPDASAGTAVQTVIHLQDYNAAVLELVTLPNVLLTWYLSASSQAYRETESHDGIEAPTPSAASPGEVHITPELIDAFKASLSNHGISIRLYSGAWSEFTSPSAPDSLELDYDLVLTSETIYRVESLPSLINALRTASGHAKAAFEVGSSAASALSWSAGGDAPRDHSIVLVAAKVVYFGVGGGVREFVDAVETAGGHSRTVWTIEAGVGRQVLQVEF